MLDPTAAVIVFGEKPSCPLAPTVTVCTPEVDDDVVDTGAAAFEVVVESPGDPY